MRTLLIGLMTVLLAWPAVAQQVRKVQRPGSEQHKTQVDRKARPRPAPRGAVRAAPAAPTRQIPPEPLYDTEKAMR
jgi:hypothetical protein